MRLSKMFRNGIIEAIKDGGLDPSQCDFEFNEERARVSHRSSGGYFLVEGDFSHFTCTWVIGDQPPWGPLDAFSWDKVEGRGKRWAEDVKADVNTPDLWAQLQRDRAVITGTQFEDVENTPFTPDEQAEIAKTLREIKEFAKKTYSLNEAQMQALGAKLDDIAAAAGRIGRKDWQLLVFGVMFGVIVTGLLPPEAVHDILMRVFHGLGTLFGGGGTPPQLPPPMNPTLPV